MKKTLLFICCLLVGINIYAQDNKIAIKSATASSAEDGHSASNAIDGSTSTIWHSTWKNEATKFPVSFTITLKEATHVDYIRYIPRRDADGNTNGNWNEVYISYCPTTTGNSFTSIGNSYKLNGSGAMSDLWLTEEGVTCGRIKFTINSGDGGFASAAEIEAYAIDNSAGEAYGKYFTDKIYSQLKPEVTSSQGIEDATLKTLVDNMLNDAESYKKFRVGEYEAYLSTETLINTLKVSSYYNNYENPTGIYLKAGESCLVAVNGISTQYPVGLTIKNWVTNENSSSYSLRNGLNQITASTEGNVFVNYYADDFENAPNVKIHFINAPVQGYWDQATMTNADWIEMLKGRSANDNTILITRSEHAQLAYPVSAWLKHCPTNVDSTMTLYQQVQWAQRDILGLEKYGRQVKNRQLFYATTSGFMAAGGEGSYCNVSSLGAIMVPDAAKFDFWGVGHEWGHNNQVTTGFKWSGCGETTNNIYASWGQIHFTGKPSYLRLEDEVTGIDEYSGMRGGRMQTYFEEGLRKGVAWQLQDGPDYHNITPETKNVVNENFTAWVTTTSRNYDHFVKLAPFWQLNLWGTLAGKCPDIIPMVIESIRSTKNYTSYHGTNGKKQINWMKLACDSAKIDLLPFFEKAGMLRPINAYIEDYQPGWNIITEAMISDLKNYVKEQGYPAFTEEINYINGHNYRTYRDCLKLEVPEEIGEGCKLNGNKVTVQHSVVKNAVAFETYNSKGELLRITMYGLGSDDQHSYTQVLYPKNNDASLSSAYIMAVGYDGTRIKIYEEGGLKEECLKLLQQAKLYATRIDGTGYKIGFLIPELITEYTAIVAEIDSLVTYTNSREHTYGTWITTLSEAMESLTDYCVPMTPNRYYSLATSSNANNYVGNSTDGIKTYKFQKGAKPKSLKWKFIESETEGVYYIQQRTTGRYISLAQSGYRVEAKALNIADAVAFSLEVVAPGELYIQRADDKDTRLYIDKSLIYAGKQTNENAKWFVLMEDETEDDDMLALPQTSTDEEITAYYLIRADNGEYAYSYLPKSKDKGRIATDIYEDSDDFYFWFYFKQGSEEGKYTIHNYQTQKAVTKADNLLYIDKDAEVVPEFTITLDEQGKGLIISSEGGNWQMQKGSTTELIEMSSEGSTTWKLQCIYTFNTVFEPLASITINKSEVTLLERESIKLTVETAPIVATDHSVTWSSSDESVAKVSATGKVVAVAEGKATITATANDGSELTATCEVTVKKEDTGINSTTTTTLSVKSEEGAITIEGLDKGVRVNVYNMVGRLIASETASENTLTINTGLTKGNIAIVTVGTYSIKVQIK